MPVLTAVDILGIQRYVFGSNRLRDVLAASWMVDHVTQRAQLEQWAGGGSPSVLLAAGGNAIVEFATLDHARSWAAHYSRWLHETAPGLDVVVVHRPYIERPLAWALRVLQVDVARAKQERIPGVAQLGLSVTASCSVTGLPATSVDQGDLLSPAVWQLRMHVDDARARWAKLIPDLDHLPAWSADFPDETDHMGRTHGQKSLVGVVHVDGNGVGDLIKRWLDRCLEQGAEDKTVRAEYQKWSEAINEAGRAALLAVTERVAGCIEAEDDHCVLRGTPFEHGYRLHDWRDDRIHRRQAKTVLLPLRPVLLGGDDLTFLCDGRIALDLAVAALREIERHEIPHLGPDGAPAKLTACAGVALVKAHAPFHHSYELADDLCRCAKRARLESNEQTGTETGSWLDWHVGTMRPGETVLQIRGRVYSRGNTEFTMRPYPLSATPHRSQSWTWLDDDLLGPASDGGARGLRGEDGWSGSRSRVKALASVVLDGAEEVQRQLEAWRATGARAELPGGLDADADADAGAGFIGERTPLLDAIELLDLHLRLERDTRRSAAAARRGDTMAEGASQ
jgi:hypothetical protein